MYSPKLPVRQNELRMDKSELIRIEIEASEQNLGRSESSYSSSSSSSASTSTEQSGFFSSFLFGAKKEDHPTRPSAPSTPQATQSGHVRRAQEVLYCRSSFSHPNDSFSLTATRCDPIG